MFKSEMVPVRPKSLWSLSVLHLGGWALSWGACLWVGGISATTLTSPLDWPKLQGQTCMSRDGAVWAEQGTEGTQGCRLGGPLNSQPTIIDLQWPELEGLRETALSTSVITAGETEPQR